MGDLARVPFVLGPKPCIGPHSALGMAGGQSIGGTATAAWPVANTLLLMPFRTARDQLVTGFGLYNGTSVSGNFDVAILTRGGKRLVSTGSVAQAGVSSIQRVTLGTPFLLPADSYYLGLVLDNATGQVNRHGASTPGLALYQGLGMAEVAACGVPIPASVVPASLTTQYAPDVAVFFRGSP